MRPITDAKPKSLIELHGRSLLETILDRLEGIGVGRAVINLFYKGEMIEERLAGRTRPEILFARETEPLETGGGVKQALPLLGTAPFYVINGDVCWLDGRTPALRRLAEAWDESAMDALLLLHPTAFATGYGGMGDFVMAPDGCLRRRAEREVAPFVFTGIQIVHPGLFAEAPDGPFSLNLLYDRAAQRERLWGLRHDGEWFHIGTPEGLEEVEEALHPLVFRSVHR